MFRKIIKVKPNLWTNRILFSAAIALGGMFVGLIFYQVWKNESYIDISMVESALNYVFYSVTMIVALNAILSSFETSILEIHTEPLRKIYVCLPFLQEEIAIKDITSWLEIEENNPNRGRFKTLFFSTDKGIYDIDSFYSHYHEFKTKIVTTKPRNNKLKELSSKKHSKISRSRLSIHFLFLCFLNLWLIFSICETRKTVSQSDILTLNDNIKDFSTKQVFYYWGRFSEALVRRNQQDFFIDLQNHPSVTFTIPISFFQQSTQSKVNAWPILNAMKIGRPVVVEYHKKDLLKVTQPPSQSHKKQVIPLYGLRHQGNSYFNLENTNQRNAQNKAKRLWFVISMSVISFIIGIYLVVVAAPKRG